jgi:hypothetical protein
LKEENMRTKRLVIATILLLSLLFGSIPSAYAGSATHYSVRQENATIPWLYPLTEACTRIPAGIIINTDADSSDRVKNLTVTEMEGGANHIQWTDLIRGTASDNTGATYKFVYENNTTFSFDGTIVTADMKDTFSLKGGNVNFTVGFHWRWQYEADYLNAVDLGTDLGVDPFIFATVDGVIPDPNIVPGSWQILSNRGDPNPLNCDPL